MRFFLRCKALILLAVLPVFAGCAGTGCGFLNYEDGVPSKSTPIVMPAGVPATAEGGEFRVPDGSAQPITGKCPAEPPMTLDPELLIAPEDREAAAEEMPAEA